MPETVSNAGAASNAGRHALAAGLIGDLAGFAAAIIACHWLFGDVS